MSKGPTLNYLDDPQKYCNLVTELIEKASDEWQATWKSAILELFESSEYNIHSVNALLKVIEKAFKERKYHIRAQAFDCWQFFIKEVEKKAISEKLINVILIPLSASNHSVKIVLDAKLKAWLTLLRTNTLCKSISKEKGIPSLLKILYGPHTLEIASSHKDFTELCGTIYGLMVRKCLKNDDGGVILSYLPKALPILSHNQISQRLGKEIWVDVTEYVSIRKWPVMLFNHLMKTLENLLLTNRDQDKTFMRELLPILICECNSYPMETMMPHLNLLTRCLFYSASADFNLASTLEYLAKKFKKREQVLFDELNKTLTDFAEHSTEHLQKCWTAIVPAFCKWNKSEVDSDVYIWMLLFPVKHLHQEWNSIIQDCMQMCFENIYSVSKLDALIRNVTRRLNTFLNKSENVPLSLLSAATCLCKVMLQKTKPSDDLTVVKDSLMTINEKLPSQTAVEGPQITLICKYLACLLYFVNRYPEYDLEFGPIIREHSGCIMDADKELKEYPVAQLLSKYTNKTKEDEKFSNVLNIIRTTPNKSTNPAFLARSSPSANKLPNGSPFGARSAGATKNCGTPTAQKSTSKDDDVQFVAIKSTPKNSPMTEHQKEMAKEKSYIPAMYEDLSQSQSHCDSQSTVPEKIHPVIKIRAIDVIEENAVLPSNDTSGDSADEIPASLDFRQAIRKDKLSVSFSSKKSLFSDAAPTNDGADSSAQLLKRKSMRIESKVADTTAKKRARLSCPNRIQTTAEQPEPVPAETPIAPLESHKGLKKVTGRRKSVAECKKDNAESATPSTATTTTECESQNLFVPKTQSKPPPPPSSASASSETKSARRKSLKCKSSNIEPSRSPINTRKRKSIVSTGADTSAKNLSAFVIDDSCSEMDEPSVKKEKSVISINGESHAGGSGDTASGSSVVTVIAPDTNVSAQTDSVMIVDEDIEQQIIVIDSESPLSASTDTIPCPTETEQLEAAIENVKVTEEEETVIVENTIEEDLVNKVEEHERSANESVKSTSSSFNLALSESLKTDKDCDQQVAQEIAPNDQANDVVVVVDVSPPSEQPQPSDAPTEKLQEEIVQVDDIKPASGAIENGAAPTSEDANVSSASPAAGHSRALQMLQMVYSGPSTLTQPKGRFKSNVRRSRVNTPPTNGRSSTNGMNARTPINSRQMKLLQVNGHAEGSIKPSPNKVVNFLDKKETLRYTPKECTSPSILKKPNLNGTISPKSPKSVNFAERLTDTREYDVNDTNPLDSLCSANSQSDNLISDDEATSQETLYPCLHNCTDDIGNITERLYLNQHQLDTLKRIGIETVGQLASASTSVGKSIPVGDNRVQRLRNALQAYDNDRKLKGLRAPSVRRKITYKSPVEVNSIIEILDDEAAVNGKGGNANKLAGDKTWEPLVVVDMLSSEEVAAYQSGSPFKDGPSLIGETQESFSPFGETQRITQSPITPSMNDSTYPAASQTAPNVVSSTVDENVTTAETNEVLPVSTPLSPSKATSTEQPAHPSCDKDLPLSSTAANTIDDEQPRVIECIQSAPENVPAHSTHDIGCDRTVEHPEQNGNVEDAAGMEDVRDPIADERDKMEAAQGLLEVGVVDAESTPDKSVKKLDSTVEEEPVKNGDFWECTQDDEQDFICTNHEESVFPNRNRRTYSKLMKTTTLVTNARKPLAVAVDDAEPKCSLPEPINGETNVTQMAAVSASELEEELVGDQSSTDEQQSVSIFSAEPVKSAAEDLGDTNDACGLQDVESTAPVLDAAAVEDDIAESSSPSNGETESVCQSEDVPEARADTEKVFSAELRRILEPYVGPTALSLFTEEQSRVELNRIIKSAVECVLRTQSAGLMDAETRDGLLRQMSEPMNRE